MESTEDNHLKQRIAEETGKIKVASYQKTASIGGWAGGGRTLWAVAAIGAAAGAAMGVVAPFLPLLVGASSFATAVGAIGASVATFAAVGLGMGFGGGLILGRISGASASVAEEQEKRLKRWTAKQLLSKDPNTKIVEDEQDVEKVKAYKPFWKADKDTLDTYLNPRVGGFFALVGALGGLLMAAAFNATGGMVGGMMPALEHITGLAAAELTPGVITATFAGIGASFGALFSVNLPKITSDLTEYTGKVVSGEKLGKEWGPREKEPDQQPTINTYEQTTSREEIAQNRTSYRDLIRNAENQSSEIVRS